MTDVSGASDIVVVSTGEQGPPGIRGNSVISSPNMPTATIGMNGDMYLDTTTSIMYGPKAAGQWPSIGTPLVGPTGLPGNTLLYGITAPSNSIGNDGDFYINTAAWLIYGPKNSGSWPATGVSIVGPVQWSTPTTWTGPGTSYVVGPPASTVINAGSSYVCLANHTSSSVFNTDLSAGKWALLAQGSTGGITDAPSDSTTYGRLNAAWTHVLALAGGTMTGVLTLNANPVGNLDAATKQYVDALSGAPGLTVPIAFIVPNLTAAITINIQMAIAVTIAASLGGSQAIAQTAPGGSVTFTLNKTTSAFGTPTALGTVVFAASSRTATFAGAGGSLAIGDILQLTTASTDVNFLNGSITVLTTRM
jgi:hypothetical protein